MRYLVEVTNKSRTEKRNCNNVKKAINKITRDSCGNLYCAYAEECKINIFDRVYNRQLTEIEIYLLLQ